MALHNNKTNKKFQPKHWNAKKPTFSNNKSWSKKPYYNNTNTKAKNNKNNKRDYKFKPYDPKDYDRVRKQIIREFIKEYPNSTILYRANRDPLTIVKINPYSYRRFKRVVRLFKRKFNHPSYLIDFIRYLRLFSIYSRKPSQHKHKARIRAFIKFRSKSLEKNNYITGDQFKNLFSSFHRYKKLHFFYPIAPYVPYNFSRFRAWRLRMYLRKREFRPTLPNKILTSSFIKEAVATSANPSSILNRLQYFKFMTGKSWYLPDWYRKLVKNPVAFEGNPIYNVRSKKHRFENKKLGAELYYQYLERTFSIFSNYNVFNFEGLIFNEKFLYQLAAYVERATLLRLIKLRLYRPKEYIHKPHMPHMYLREENDLRFSDLVFDNRQIITPYFNASHDNYYEDPDNGIIYQDVDESIKTEEIPFEEKLYPTRFRDFPTSSYNIKAVSVKNNIFITVSYQGRSALNRIRNWRLFEKLKGDNEAAAQIKPHKLIENVSLLGRTIAVRCGGMMTGYKGRRRSTPSACEEMGRRVGKFLQSRKIRSAMLTINAHDDNMVNAAIKGISEKRYKLEFPELVFKPLIPHGHGLRAKKRRRV